MLQFIASYIPCLKFFISCLKLNRIVAIYCNSFGATYRHYSVSVTVFDCQSSLFFPSLSLSLSDSFSLFPLAPLWSFVVEHLNYKIVVHVVRSGRVNKSSDSHVAIIMPLIA